MTAEHEQEAPGRRRSGRFTTAVTTLSAFLIATALMLVNVFITARALGVEGRGQVAFLIVVGAISSQAVLFGVHDANALYGAADKHVRARLATNSVVLAALFGSMAAAVVLALMLLLPALMGPVSASLVTLALAAVPFSVLRPYLAFLVQADYGFAVTNASTVAGPLTTVVVNGTLALTGSFTVTSAILSWIGGQLLGLAILVEYLRRTVGFARPDLGLARKCLRFGLRSHLGRSAWMGAERADIWIVGVLASPRDLGLYSIAVAWSDALHYVPGLIATLLRPDIVRSSTQEAGLLAARVLRRASVISCVTAVLLIVFAPFLCGTVFGAEFADSAELLRILALGAVAIAAVEILQNALVAMGRPWLGGFAIVSVLAAIVLGDLLLVPAIGVEGAAIANVAAWWLGGLLAVALFVRAGAASLSDLRPRLQDLTWLPARIVRGASSHLALRRD